MSFAPLLVGGASTASLLLLALFLARGRAPLRLMGDAFAIGLTLGATVAAALAPFELRANPLHFSSPTIAFLFAGLPEEGAKMLGVAAFLRAHPFTRNRADIVFAAGALALAFASLEDLLYLGGARAAWPTLAWERAVTAMPFHVFEGLAGGFVVATAQGRRGVALALLAWIGLACVHGIYDLAAFAGADAPMFWAPAISALGGDPANVSLACLTAAQAFAALAGLAAALRVAPHVPAPRQAWARTIQSRGLALTLGVALAGAGALALLVAAGASLLVGSSGPLLRSSAFATSPLALGLAFLRAPAPPALPLTRRLFVGALGLAACVAAAMTLVLGPGEWRELRATAYDARGDRLAARGDNAGAIEAYGQALSLQPAQVYALSRRAAASAALNRLDAAAADLDAALRLKPGDMRLRVQRADLDRRRNAPAEAVADLGAALAVEAGNPQLLALRATARLEAGDAAGARADLAEARGLAPNDAIVRRASAALAVDAGDFDGALRELNAELRADPGDAASAFQRGRVWFYKGDFGQAAQDFAHAGQRSGDLYPALWRYLAETRGGRGGAATLLQTFSTSADAWPAPVARMLLGLQTPAETQAAATDTGQRCEADFYFALSRLNAATHEESASRLQAAMKECPTAYVEYEGAKAELHRITP